ncbi:MAG: ABC transporter substrate-binding protein [Chloroflexota bacterium]|nr:ABC transporter substrate-binding protein [Chloroflexota bacterium]
MKLKPLFLLSIVALAALFAVACGSAPEEAAAPAAPVAPAPATAAPAAAAPAPTSAPAPTTAPAAAPAESGGGGQLKVAMRTLGNAQGLPSQASGGTGDTIPGLIGLMESLTERKKADLLFYPHLAESYEVEPDLSKISVKLREGVQFHHDWGEMGAEDVKWSFGDAGVENQESVFGNVGYLHEYQEPHVVVDQHTVEFPLKSFTSEFEGAIIGLVFVYSSKYINDMGRDHAFQNPVGTGPFQMESWTPNDEFIGSTFMDYWDTPASFGELSVKEIPEDSTRVALIKTDAVHIIDPVPFSFLPDLLDVGMVANSDNQGGATQAITYSGNFWMFEYPENDNKNRDGQPVTPRPGFEPDDEHPWIGDPNDPARMESARLVRHALSRAIDRDLIVEEVLLGNGFPEYINFYSSSLPEHKEEWIIPYDPDGAVAMLEEAGYPVEDFPAFQIYVQQLPNVNFEVFDAVATMWINIGLDVTVDSTAYQAFRPRLVDREWNGLTSCCAWPGCGGPLLLMDQPRLAAREGSTIGEGDWNPGFEVLEVMTYVNEVEANPLDEEARVAANIKEADFFYHWMLSTGVVHADNPVWVNPKFVEGWEMEITGLFNNLETITLKQ